MASRLYSKWKVDGPIKQGQPTTGQRSRREPITEQDASIKQQVPGTSYPKTITGAATTGPINTTTTTITEQLHKIGIGVQ